LYGGSSEITLVRTDSFDFLATLYKRKHTHDSFVREVEGILGAAEVVASVLPFYSSVKLQDWLRSVARPGRELSEVQIGSGISLFHLSQSKTGPDGTRVPLSGHFFIYDHADYQNIHVIVTLESSPFFELLRRLVDTSFPKVLTTFVTHRRFQRLLHLFRDHYSLSELIIDRASLRIRFEERTAANRRQVVPMVSWPEMDIDRAFDWVNEQNGWFQSFKFTAYRDEVALAQILFSRQGYIRTSGMFPEVFSAFTMPVCKIIDENVRFFGQRSRKDRRDLSVRPLTIDFGSDQIAEPEERRRFIESMRRFAASSVSILHGNPYVHLSVLDYKDGSAFDIWVLSPNSITIVPQMKGTVAAIKRVINHIFDFYAEGQIREYSRPAI
jgi:hypothetical protein